MLKLYSLISGSSGNCTLITDGRTKIMIDCGMSGKRAAEALEKIAINPKTVDALFISHEHIDHTRGAGIMARKYKIPIYTTSGTFAGFDTGKIDDGLINEINPDITYGIGDLGVTPFQIPHDAKDPCGFVVTDGKTRFATATDIGIMTDNILSRIYGCESILLESNHDIDMLRFGEYPYALKQRILSDIGHLSNKAAADAAVRLTEKGTKHIMLGHLSDKNNMPDIAQMETYNALTDNGINVGNDMTLQVAKRYDITEML